MDDEQGVGPALGPEEQKNIEGSGDPGSANDQMQGTDNEQEIHEAAGKGGAV